MGRILRHAELDELLDPLALEPEGFEKRAHQLIDELDAQETDLEISDPVTWRRGTPAPAVPRGNLESQFRAEVERIQIMDRESEARLARRIEFARLRLEEALESEGATLADLEGGTSWVPSAADPAAVFSCSLAPRLCRRWMELHALRTELVERNLYLVLINVERYAHTTAGRADLIQEGSAALYRAVDGFDWRRGLLFRTYAVHWLNQAFRSYLYNFSHTVRVPVYLQKAWKHIDRAIQRLGDPDASVTEIARESQLGENLVTMALAAARSTRSLDAPVKNDEGATLRELLPPDGDADPYSTDLEDKSLSQGLGEALGELSPRERLVIEMRYGIGRSREHTLAEVAGELGVSLERIRQIQVRALNKMRTPALKRTVDPFLN